MVFQNVSRKHESLSEMMLLGRPKCGHTCWKYNSVVSVVVVVFVHGMKRDILLKQHTTTYIESCLLWVVGSQPKKSIEIDS